MRIKNNLDFDSVSKKVRAGIGLYAQTEANRMEDDAKRSATWTDRTGNARNSIQGDFGWEGDTCKIVLSGNTDYFKYLELAHGKQYAILVPTTQKHAPAVLKAFRKVFK